MDITLTGYTMWLRSLNNRLAWKNLPRKNTLAFFLRDQWCRKNVLYPLQLQQKYVPSLSIKIVLLCCIQATQNFIDLSLNRYSTWIWHLNIRLAWKEFAKGNTPAYCFCSVSDEEWKVLYLQRLQQKYELSRCINFFVALKQPNIT